MSLKEKINEDMKSAMRSKNSALLGTIRLIQAAIKQKEVDDRIVLDNSSIVTIIEKMLKQRNDSIEAFKKANRTDLVDKEEFEVTVLKAYMPEQLDHGEVEQIIQDIIKKTGATSMKERWGQSWLKLKRCSRAKLIWQKFLKLLKLNCRHKTVITFTQRN